MSSVNYYERFYISGAISEIRALKSPVENLLKWDIFLQFMNNSLFQKSFNQYSFTIKV